MKFVCQKIQRELKSVLNKSSKEISLSLALKCRKKCTVSHKTAGIDFTIKFMQPFLKGFFPVGKYMLSEVRVRSWGT